MSARGLKAEFRATGQTGILISGRGVAIDAVVADFISGAAEWLTPANDPDHWDVVEGQGSLFHPSFAGVTLGLLHGASPTPLSSAMSRPGDECAASTTRCPRSRMSSTPPSEPAASPTRLSNASGIAINTEALDGDAARALLSETGKAHRLPCVDPIRTGVAPLVDALIARYSVLTDAPPHYRPRDLADRWESSPSPEVPRPRPKWLP